MDGTRILSYPRTLYKPSDIENARRNVERYRWAREIVDAWKEDVAFVLERNRDFFDELIPELTPGTHYGQSCPHCVGKQSLMGAGRFRWTVTEPDQIICEACGTVYPNPDYPETGVLACSRMGQIFTYYETPEERAHPDDRARYAFRWLGDRPEMTSFTGLIRTRKVEWASRQALTLARLYALTGDIACAERVVWIHDRFARVFPNYLYHSYDGSIADWPPAEVAANMGKNENLGGLRGGRFPKGVIRHAYGLNEYEDYSTLFNGFWGAGRLSTHGKGSGAGMLLDMTVAYDLVREARFADERDLLDEETRNRIVRDLLVAGCVDAEQLDTLSNLGVVTFSLSAAVGLLLDQPDRVRRAVDGWNRIIEQRYHFDGFYTETPSYAITNFGTMRELPDLLMGYSDPEGNEEGAGGKTLNPFATGRFRLALESMLRMLAPGNRLPVIGDTHFDSGISPIFAEVMAARLGGRYAGLLETVQDAGLAEKGSEYALWYRPFDLIARGATELPLRTEWFPGWHVGVMRGGSKTNDTALYFNGNENRWTAHTTHRHRDCLSISFYAFGEELVSDRGYFSGSSQLTPDGRSGQRWTSSTHAHNLVVVDEDEQASQECGSTLELIGFAPGIEILQASGINVYPQCSQYRRTCALVQAPGGTHYVVDFFRVSGGSTHQYSFHCNGSLIDASPNRPTSQPVELSEAWSDWLEKPRVITPDAPNIFTWRFGDVRLDTRLLNTSDTLDRVIIADAPAWRHANLAEFEKPPIQQILAEHRAEYPKGELVTQYATVLVPYQTADSPVLDARLLANDPDSGVLAIEVRFEDRTDYIVSTGDQQERQFGHATVAGEFAFASVDTGGRAVQTYLLKGTRLMCGELHMNFPEPEIRLEVASVADRTFHLAEPPSTGVSAGSTMLAGEMPQTGYRIESVGSDSITVCEYPAIDCKQAAVLNARWLCADS